MTGWRTLAHWTLQVLSELQKCEEEWYAVRAHWAVGHEVAAAHRHWAVGDEVFGTQLCPPGARWWPGIWLQSQTSAV